VIVLHIIKNAGQFQKGRSEGARGAVGWPRGQSVLCDAAHQVVMGHVTSQRSPVRQTKPSFAFFHLLFELLHAVQESHHCMVKLVVPEEPQAPRAVQGELLEERFVSGSRAL